MGLSIFKIFQSNDGRFVSERAYRKNLRKQFGMNTSTLSVLRKHGVTEDAQCKIEFFFYADDESKGNELCKKLLAMGYSSSCKPSAHNKRIFLINGWTNKLTMTGHNITDWTKEMCKLGYEHDCDFDGWGTNDF